jgi:RHS repeat-associated protein
MFQHRFAPETSTFCSNANYRVWNTYDPLGRRIGKETQYQNGTPSARHYLYDGWNLIAESIHHSSFTNHNFYVWGLDLSGTEQGAGGVGGLLAVFRDGNWHVPLADANGNITEYISGSSGTVVARYAYDAFGGTIAQSGPMAGAFTHRFSTKYLDTETGLYDYGRRFYDPIWGRWLNRDPIEEEGGLNLYGFVDNDPVNGIDFIGEKRVGKWIEPDIKDGWSIWGTGRFPGPGWSGEFRGRPATLFDFAAKFHDLHYELNDLKFGFASGTIGHVLPFIREDGKTLSRKAKADFIFRKMNEVGTEGGVWVGAVNWAACAVFYDDTKYFCKGDDFANALLQPETPRLAKPEQYLMIPYSHLKEPRPTVVVKRWKRIHNTPHSDRRRSMKVAYPDFMKDAPDDLFPGLWAWAESVYGETWKKIKRITNDTDASFSW